VRRTVVILGQDRPDCRRRTNSAGKGVAKHRTGAGLRGWGLARTVEYNGYRFDIGATGLHQTAPDLEKIWKDVLGDDLLVRPSSRAFIIAEKFSSIRWELWTPSWDLTGRVPRCLASLRGRVWRPCFRKTIWKEVSTASAGGLFRTFFESYTEKVWGLLAAIQADMGEAAYPRTLAGQRCYGISAGRANVQKRDAQDPDPSVFSTRDWGLAMMLVRMREVIESQSAARVV